MKLLIVSDSHGNRSMLKELKERYESSVDAMIHCGDSELRAIDPVLQGYHVVQGNCDLDLRFPEELILEIAGETIFVTHGHLFQIKSSLLNLYYRAKEKNASFIFFGHSHLYGVEQLKDTILVNPGSILYPRGRREQTYCFLEKNGSTCTIQFLNPNHEVIDSVTLEVK